MWTLESVALIRAASLFTDQSIRPQQVRLLVNVSVLCWSTRGTTFYYSNGTDLVARRKRPIPRWRPGEAAERDPVRFPPRWDPARAHPGGRWPHSCACSSPDTVGSYRCLTGSPLHRTWQPPHLVDSHLHRAVDRQRRMCTDLWLRSQRVKWKVLLLLTSSTVLSLSSSLCVHRYWASTTAQGHTYIPYCGSRTWEWATQLYCELTKQWMITKHNPHFQHFKEALQIRSHM